MPIALGGAIRITSPIPSMATIQNDLVIQGLSGNVGRHLAIRQQRDGKLGLVAAEGRRRQPGYTGTRDAGQRRLYEALFYRKTARHTSGENCGQLASSVSVADIIHPPEIHRINVANYTGAAGETIEITAGDDANVASVGVLIVTEDGQIVEKGSAIVSDRNPYVWHYSSTKPAPSRFVKILVDVADLVPSDET